MQSYLNANPDWVYTDLSSKRKPAALGLLKNGHRVELKPIKLDGEKYVLSNTCAFDAFVQLLCSAYHDSVALKALVDRQNETLFKLIRQVSQHGVGTVAYKQRAEIMKAVYNIQRLPENIYRINGECCIASLVKTVWLFPVITEVSLCSSENCPDATRTNELQILTVQLSNAEQIVMLEKHIQTVLRDRITNCLKEVTEYSDQLDSGSYVVDRTLSDWPLCDGRRTCTMRINDNYFFAEVIVPNPHSTIEVAARLLDLPQHVTVQNKTFFLRGVIGFTGGTKKTDIGHYVAFCYRGRDYWQSFDDLRNSVSNCNAKTVVRIHVLFYAV